jgi:dipeptidyl aminopeptidase/acylaminoacyl peptidase
MLALRSRRSLPALALLLSVAGALPARAELPPLIPREVLFGNPERANPKLSPDGKRLAWLAPDEKNVLQVWVKTIGAQDAKKVTADPKRGIRQYAWAQDDRTLLYLQDSDGDENYHVYGADLLAGNVRDLTPFQGVRAEIVQVSPTVKDRFLVGLNLRDRKVFDVHAVELRTGAVTLDTENPGDIVSMFATDDLVVRGGGAALPDGGTELRVRGAAGGAWKPLARAGYEDELDFVDFSADGQRAYLRTTLGADTARILERDLANGAEKVLFQDPKSDAMEVLVHPIRHVVQAVATAPARLTWKVIDPDVAADFAAIAKLSRGDFKVVSRDRADRTWIVAFNEDRGPVRWFTFDRATRKGTFLFSNQPKLEGLALAEMKPVALKARDGLELNGYLTLPVGAPAKGLPMVLAVHGGPWARDSWGFNPNVQWLANRGYAVLQVNFRGSTGYGKKFLNAGNREWGRKMQDDLTDAVKWAVAKGIADPKRVAIMGGSYGGYATLAGAAFTPEVYRCGVDVVGPSSIKTLLSTIPPYWAPMKGVFAKRVGDIEDPKDEALLRAASPLHHADKIRIPLLIGQGANDPRVKQAESEQIVDAIAKNGGQAVYVVYPDEGHGFARPENRTDFNARAEAFLKQHLGGRAEPLVGERIPGSTAVVKVVGPQPRS